MICTYCRAQNGPDDHRCGRCGRRLQDDNYRRQFPVQTMAVAPALDLAADSEEGGHQGVQTQAGPRLVALRSESSADSGGDRRSVQAPLFPAHGVPRTTGDSRTAPLRQAPMQPAPSTRRKAAGAAQPSLFDATGFDAIHQGSGTLSTSVGASVYSGAEVADAKERSFAALTDAAVTLIGFVLFWAAFWWIAGPPALEQKQWFWFAGILAALALFSKVAYCAAGIDSPGLQLLGLRLLNFDGRRPSRKARFCRLAGGLVSILSLGIGLVWALLDEERLTWHDHMSSTFPTRRG